MTIRLEIRKRRFLWIKAALDLVSILDSGGGPVADYSEFEVIASDGGRRVRIPTKSRDHSERVVRYLRNLGDDLGLDFVQSKKSALREDVF